MPLYKKKSFSYLWIALVMFAAYLPVSSFFFAIKNDFFRGYFPAKLFLSEHLRSGSIPIWNPFINYGFPIYGDMSLGYWSPSNWVYGIVGYNTYTFTLELLMYILLSGYGMFLVSGLWLSNKKWRFVIAVAYMCSGFNASHMQHFNWITASALLPYCFYFLFQLTRTCQLKYIVPSLFFFSLYLSSVHPGMIIGGFLFFSVFIIWQFVQSNNKRENLQSVLLLAPSLSILCFGVIWGYASVLPYTNRSAIINLEEINEGSTTLASWFSLLFPFATMDKNTFFTGDFAFRNTYIGILPLAALIVLLRSGFKTKAWFYFGIGAGFLVLSSPIFSQIYHHIPLINTVRLRAEFRLFTVFAFLLVAIQILQQFGNLEKTLVQSLKGLLFITIASTVISVVYILITKQSILFHPPEVGNQLATTLKFFLYALSFPDKIVIQGLIQSMIIVAYITDFKSMDSRHFWKITSLEFVLSTLLNMPFTGVGTTPLKTVNELLGRAPKQSLIISKSSEKDILSTFPNTDSILNSWSFYSRFVAQKKIMHYPLVLKNTETLFNSGEQEALQAKPFYFSENGSNIIPTYNSNTEFLFDVTATQTDTIVIKQNNFKGWRGFVDGQETSLFTMHHSLLGITVKPGIHKIRLVYKNETAAILLIAYQAIMATLALFMLYRYYRMRYILP